MTHKFFTDNMNNKIAYNKIQGDKSKPTVIFLSGFMSDMQGNKALALQEFCEQNSISFIRFDYFGHGLSDGKFTDGTIGIWKQNVIDIIDNLTIGNLIIVGSSMGGWLMILATLARPKRVSYLIGIASAPDFTENLIWDKLSNEQKHTLEKNGVHNFASEYSDTPYPISLSLIKEGRNHLLLNDKININIPVELIHGDKDCDVPCKLSEYLAKKITSDKVNLTIVKNGDHRMSTDENIELLLSTLENSL